MVALLTTRLTRAVYGYNDVLRHTRSVHVAMVDAIEERDRVAFDKLRVLHGEDLERGSHLDRNEE
ncbi:MAG: hypothetical protein ABIR57_02210 [Aeromicrobium sp.]